MEEYLVEQNAAQAPEGANPVADTQGTAGEEVVDAMELLGEEGTVLEEGEAPAREEPARADAAKTYTQREFDEAVRRKMEYATRDMQRRTQEDVNRRMAQDGAFVEAPQTMAQGIALDIVESARAGAIPKDFDLNACASVYPQFVEDCAKYGVRAAVRTVQALEGVHAKRTMARALPRSTRPSYAPQDVGQIDYTRLSDAEFSRMKAKMHDLYLQGKTVKIH